MYTEITVQTHANRNNHTIRDTIDVIIDISTRNTMLTGNTAIYLNKIDVGFLIGNKVHYYSTSTTN
jgi:hypothetical protein